MPDARQNNEFMQLLGPHYESLYRFARSMARTRAETDDLVSETLLAALTGFKNLKERQNFKAYLFTTASRIFKRQQWRFMRFLEFSANHRQSHIAGETAPDISTDVALLHDALKKLPFKTREAVTLFEISGLSLEEIVVIQGGTLSGVKSRVARGRQQLAKLLKVEDSPLLKKGFLKKTQYDVMPVEVRI
ncbi:MAG TPA: RNA polymerase sigma factor [Patescibacteria group bacterium]|nr:RNA polymerase sigma factor [Patescibacteria group bacterium]